VIKPLSRDEFKALIMSRGWSMSNLAWHWGISLEHLSRLIVDRDRPVYWDDAAAGVRILTRADAAKLRKDRLHATAQVRAKRLEVRKSQVKPAGTGYSYQGFLVVGSVVVVSNPLGYANQGDEGVVVEVSDDGSGEIYRIQFAGGEEWFDAKRFELHLFETGKTKS
jgi:hypothetical protein